MVTPLLRIAVGLSLCFSLVMAAASLAGHWMDTPVAIALVSPKGNNAYAEPPTKVAFFDLGRFLRADHAIPLDHIQQVAFAGPVGQLTVSTYFGDNSNKRYEASLYRYNYLAGKLTLIDRFESNRPSFSADGVYYDYFPAPSPDERKLAFLNPSDRKIHIYDLATEQVTVLENLELGEGLPRALSWSPDGTQIALPQYQTLYIANTQSDRVSEYHFETNQFTPLWTEDSQHLLIQQFGGNIGINEPVFQLINADDGTEVTRTQNLDGNILYVSDCESRWLGYFESDDAGQASYLLDMQSDRMIRLNDDPLLANESIEGITALPNCHQFLLRTGHLIPFNSLSQPLYSLYLFDLTTNKASLVDDEITAVVNSTDEAIYYERVASESDKRQLIRHVLVPLGEPAVLNEYPPVRASWLNWDEGMAFATFLVSNSSNYYDSRLGLLNPETGRTYLLSSADELIQSYLQLSWSDVQSSILR
jgi:WD40 repeat protein